VTASPPRSSLAVLQRYYDGVLASEGLAPLDDSKGRMRQPALRAQRISDDFRDRLRAVANALETGDAARIAPQHAALFAARQLHGNAPTDAELAYAMADGRCTVRAFSRERAEPERHTYERWHQIKRLTDGIAADNDDNPAVTPDMLRAVEILELFAEAARKGACHV
jgi:hypothetical protein